MVIELVYKFDEKSTTNVSKGELTAKAFWGGHIHNTYTNTPTTLPLLVHAHVGNKNDDLSYFIGIESCHAIVARIKNK